ncbi:hypothetical protein DVH24_023385 [Malus domestica]|uniref:Uncharacterized protein n=1 Tax=Malus domestica TaxID=3750 RepID=A0A498KS08_MALDO|nr:hypothetical protein DVH24_023385 [Malus domestica]
MTIAPCLSTIINTRHQDQRQRDSGSFVNKLKCGSKHCSFVRTKLIEPMKRDGGYNKHGNIDTKGLDKLVQTPQVIDLSDGENEEQHDGGGSLLISWEARYGIILIPKETYRCWSDADYFSPDFKIWKAGYLLFVLSDMISLAVTHDDDARSFMAVVSPPGLTHPAYLLLGLRLSDIKTHIRCPFPSFSTGSSSLVPHTDSNCSRTSSRPSLTRPRSFTCSTASETSRSTPLEAAQIGDRGVWRE